MHVEWTLKDSYILLTPKVQELHMGYYLLGFIYKKPSQRSCSGIILCLITCFKNNDDQSSQTEKYIIRLQSSYSEHIKEALQQLLISRFSFSVSVGIERSIDVMVFTGSRSSDSKHIYLYLLMEVERNKRVRSMMGRNYSCSPTRCMRSCQSIKS